MSTSVPTAVQSVARSNSCCPTSITGHHWWRIETANGPTSAGRCRFCPAEKEFFNVWEIKRWKEDGPVLTSNLLDLPDMAGEGSE